MSNFGIAGSVHAHGCADFIQQSIFGLNQLGSSRLADLMDIATPRNASLSAKSGDPQTPQNPRRAMFPLSAFDSYQRGSPSMVTAPVGTRTPDAKAAPLAC